MPNDIQQLGAIGDASGAVGTARGTRSHYLALIALMLGAFMMPLDFFIVNLALSDIGHSLQAGTTELQFVVSGYACAFSVFLITGGRLGDFYGRRRVFMWGMTGFILASILCAQASSGWALVGWRVMQGLSAAAMSPQVLATIRTVFAPAQQVGAMGLYGFVIGLAGVLGQMLGGLLLSMRPFGWGWPVIFLINVPIGLLAMACIGRFVPESHVDKPAHVDWWGMVLLTLSLLLVMYPLSQGRESGWPAWTYGMLVMSVPVAILFCLQESRLMRLGRDPLVDLHLLKSTMYVLSLVLTFVFYADSAFFLVYGLFLQQGMQWSSLHAGLAILPFGVGAILGPAMLPWLGRRMGDHVLTMGFVCLAIGFFFVYPTLLAQSAPNPLFYLSIGVAGFGHGVVLPTTTRISIAMVPVAKAGLASGITVSVLQLGAAFGAAVVSGVYFTLLHSGREVAAHVHAFGATMLVLGAVFLGCALMSVVMLRIADRRSGR